MKRGQQTGFTIVELLIVVVVIAILAAITIVGYNGIQSRAKSAVFTSGIDSFEKAVYLHKAQTGAYATSLYTVTALGPSNPAGESLFSQPSCVPATYPTTAVFKEGECSIMRITTTYDGDTSPAHLYVFSSVENTAFKTEYEAAGIGNLKKMSDTEGFTLKYSSRRQVTQQDAAYEGYINPRSGWVTQETVFAIRGAAVTAIRTNGVVTQVIVTYYLQGNQACGRGVKSLTNLGQQIASSTPGVVIEIDTGITTQCTTILR